MQRKRPIRHRSGFSLVEMLVVLTIMGILSALTVSSISSLRSTTLSTAGNQLVDVFAMARQNSISKNCFTAVIVQQQGTRASAAYCLMQSVRDETTGVFGQWAEVTPWKYLPSGVVFENNVTSGDTYMTSATLPGSLQSTASFPGSSSSIPLGPTGNNIVQCFQPDGTMVPPTPPSNSTVASGQDIKLRLIEGMSDSSGNTTYTGATVGGAEASYYDLYFIANTGTTKIVRP